MPLQVNGLEVRVVPVAPLAMAQNMEEVNAIIQFQQIMQQPAFGMDGQLAIKTEAAVDYIGDKLGVPAAVRNDAAERAVLMEEMQAQQALAAQAQAQMMGAMGAEAGMAAEAAPV
jgi:hypothetical protein